MALSWVEYWAGKCVRILAMEDFSSAWLKNLILRQKKKFFFCPRHLWAKHWEHLCTTFGKKIQQEHRNFTGEGQELVQKEAFHCPGCYFPFLLEDSTDNKLWREEQRHWGVLNYFLVWVSVRFVEGVAVTFTSSGFASSSTTQNVFIVCYC